MGVNLGKGNSAIGQGIGTSSMVGQANGLKRFASNTAGNFN